MKFLNHISPLSVLWFILFTQFNYLAAGHYRNFQTAVYTRVYEVQKMADPVWLEQSFDRMNRTIKMDKIFLETHRDMVVIGEEELIRIKKFFEDRGILASGGITITVNERNRFETYCYTNPDHRKKLREVVEFTASHFNEVMLDDFFFTNCKCESCIKAKGDRSWTDFRLQLLTQAAEELILKPARRVNPDITVIIKYPNWYEHFQGLGFNLETEPKIFDKIYTGTETRDPVLSDQHLQNYQGYQIFRYFENIKPGGNAGGWVDTGGARFADRYAEQIWLTLFAKAPEMTLFDYRQMMAPLRPSLRAGWQGQGTSFDFDRMMAPLLKEEGSWPEDATMAIAAGYSLEVADQVVGFLGHPIGIAAYKPYHSAGEDFIHNYLGMLGIPIDLKPEFPVKSDLVLLTETAKYDPDIVGKIEKHLMDGKRVLITSGLLRALQGHGIEAIAELEYTDRKASVRSFRAGWGQTADSDKDILIPQIQYLTNDSWEEVSALDGPNGWPILHSAAYGNGMLFILTIPDNFADLYHLPVEVTTRIKQILLADLYVRINGPSQIALFVYDNNTFIVESFLDDTAEVEILIDPKFSKLIDALSEEALSGERLTPRNFWGTQIGEDAMKYTTQIKPHSFRVFRCE
jgi:hypothetical protein